MQSTVFSCITFQGYLCAQKLQGDLLSTAIKANDSSVVLNWLKNLPEVDKDIWVQLVQILQQSAYYLSEDVVYLFQPPSIYVYNSLENVNNLCLLCSTATRFVVRNN